MADLFEALVAPARRAILDELCDRDGQTLFEICTRLTMKHNLPLTRQAISQHLDVLEEAGLVGSKREGRYKYHYLNTIECHRKPLAEIRKKRKQRMKIVITSVYVDDQEKALRFYTDVLGFVKKQDIPMGHARWLTVVSPNNVDGVELLLEPSEHPAAGPFRKALVEDGIPYTSFGVDDIQAKYSRLCSAGVHFTQPPSGDGSDINGSFRRYLRQPHSDCPTALTENRGLYGSHQDEKCRIKDSNNRQQDAVPNWDLAACTSGADNCRTRPFGATLGGYRGFAAGFARLRPQCTEQTPGRDD